MSRKRCIIIGSGLGGLSCGTILARNGYDVTVVEQGARAGGCLQCFVRHGVKFETGMHFIGSARPGEPLHRLLRFLELDNLPLNPLDPDGYNRVKIGGDEFAFPNGREPFIERMASYFPAEKDGIARYMDYVERVAGASRISSTEPLESVMPAEAWLHNRSIDDVLAEIISDDMLRRVLVGDLPLYAAEQGHTPFSLHAFVMDFYNRSAFRIAGGSDIIADRLTDLIRERGGRVLLNSRATRIVCDNTRATGVEINGSELLEADLVLATIHPARLMELLDTPLLRPAFRRRMSSMRNTPSNFSVYMKFRPGTVPYMNRNCFSYPGGTPWNCERYTPAEWPKGYLYMHFCPAEPTPYATNGIALSYMSIDEVAPWSGTHVGHRGDEYLAFKRAKAERLIDTLCHDFPELRGNIECYYTSTPLTYLDYTGTEGGSMYGVAKDIQAGIAGRVPHRTRIPNLLIAGQNINSHGILGVLVGTIVACSEILGEHTVIQQIGEYNQ